MKNLSYIVFLLAAMLLSSCSLLRKGDKEQTQKQEAKVLDDQDSLQLTSTFIEAKKEALLGNDAVAVKLFEAVLEKSPRHDAANFEMARMYSKFKEYNKAVDYAEKAAEISPQNIWYRKMLVDLYQRTGELEKSRAQFKWLVENDDNNLRYYQDWYKLELYLENHEKALEINNKIEQITGTSQEILLRRIMLLQETGDFVKAAEAAKELLRMDPTEPDYYRELIALYNHINEPEKALEIIRQFKESGKDEGWAELMMAEQYRKMKMNDKSFEELKKAISNKNLSIDPKVQVLMSYLAISRHTDSLLQQQEILLENLKNTHPDNPITWSVIGDFKMQQEHYEDALAAFEKVLEMDSTKYPVWEQTIRLQFQLGRNKQLSRYAASAIELFPEQPLLYFLKGAAHTRSGEHEKAIKTLEMGLYFVAQPQLKVDFYSYLGDNYHATADHASSDNAYERALQIDPDNIYVMNNYAYYLSLRKQKLDKAYTMSKKVVEKKPGEATYLDTHGWVLYQQGKYQEALKVLEKALKSGGMNNAEILEHYGDCLYKTGDKQEALKYWKQALQKDEGNQKLLKKIQTKSLNP